MGWNGARSLWESEPTRKATEEDEGERGGGDRCTLPPADRPPVLEIRGAQGLIDRLAVIS